MIDLPLLNKPNSTRKANNDDSFNASYIFGRLYQALLSGDFEKLKDMVVYQDNKIKIHFRYDNWKFKDSSIKGKSVANIVFKKGTASIIHMMSSHEEQFINEIKCTALAKLYFSKDKVSLGTIASQVRSLRDMVPFFLRNDLQSFADVSEETLHAIRELGFDLSKQHSLTGLNNILKISGHLPFSSALHKPISHEDLNILPRVPNQYEVIPFRIYADFLNYASNLIEKSYDELQNLEAALEEFQRYIEKEQFIRIKQLRNGLVNLTKNEKKSRSVKAFLNDLQFKKIEVVDFEKNKEWMKVFKQNHASLQMPVKRSKKAIFHVFKSQKMNYYQLKEFRKELIITASWLCLILSGMRVNELYAMHPTYGAQSIEVPSERSNVHSSSLSLQTIYLLTTKQSKITGNSQTKNDVYVTSKLGYKAFKVISTVLNPLRKRAASHNMLLYALDKLIPQELNLKAFDSMLISNFQSLHRNKKINLKLNSQDIENLDISEKYHNWKVGDDFKVTTHMCRRSLAYYLIGYELCSFPALKQQFSHVSIAMTRWYAKNASSFQTLWSEVQEQRFQTQAEIYARIFQRMANGERIAGGKGKQKLKEIAKMGESYFEEGVNKSLLSPDYWYKHLKSRREHLHAIAPGMYCTNTQCSMRINIDLTECVDCDYDYIENVVFAESTRIEAMRHLSMLIELNDVSPSTAARLFTQIKASEKIMDDLEFKYEPYKFDQNILDMVITTRSIDT